METVLVRGRALPLHIEDMGKGCYAEKDGKSYLAYTTYFRLETPIEWAPPARPPPSHRRCGILVRWSQTPVADVDAGTIDRNAADVDMLSTMLKEVNAPDKDIARIIDQLLIIRRWGRSGLAKP